MTVKSYEVTGYIVNECITICPNCFNKLNFNENDSSTIFAETETDNTCHCENCNIEIETIVLEEI